MAVFTLTSASRAFWRAAALQAARKLDLARHLPARGESLAAALGAGAPRLQKLLDALALEGVLTDDAGAYRLAGGFDGPELAPQGAGLLAEVLRRDRPLPEEGDAAKFHQHLAEAGADAALEVSEILAPLLPPAPRVLDLGGGTGTYSRALLERLSGASATVLDRQAILALAPPAARMEYLECDILSGGYPKADVALLANVLHLYGPSDCEKLVAHARAAAKLVAVIDLYRDEHGPAEAIYFALTMALYTEGGGVHSPSQIAAWLGEGGAQVRLRRDPSAVILWSRAVLP